MVDTYLVSGGQMILSWGGGGVKIKTKFNTLTL
jgi:hypothetical protein